MTAREWIASVFVRWTDAVLRHPRIVVAVHAVVLGILAVGLPQIRLETSFESYLPEDNPARTLLEQFRRDFGSGERIVVLLEPEALYDVRFLEGLRALHTALEERMPHLDRVTSLVDARHLVGSAASLSSVPLLDPPPLDASSLDRLRSRIRSNPLYTNWIVSEDERATALVIELEARGGADAGALTDEAVLEGFDDGGAAGPLPSRGELLSTTESEAVVRTLEAVLEARAPPSTAVYVSGTPLIAHRLGELLTRDMVRFVGTSLVLTALLLFALFGSGWAVFGPLVVVGFAVVATLGWMGWTGEPITAVTEVLPSLLLAIGVADAIHVQSLFYKYCEQGVAVEDAIRRAMGDSGLAILLTSLTTAASMLAFQTAELEPVVDLGRAAPFGIAVAFASTVSLLPVLIASRSPAERGRRWRGLVAGRGIERALLAISRIGTRRPGRVLLATAAVTVAAGTAATGLRFSQDDLRWLPEDEPLRIGTEALNRTMGGMEPLEILVRIEDERLDLQDPLVMDAIREIDERASDVRVGPVAAAQSLSLADVLDETHRTIMGPGAEPATPRTREAVSQELLLFESAAPDDLARLVAGDWKTSRLAISVPFVDALHYPRYARAVLDVAQDVLERHGLEQRVDVTATGLLVVAGETFDLLLVSMVRSYVAAFGVIGLLMLLLIGRVRLGLLALVPNLAPIVIVLGLMDWLDSPIDISSMLVGGILIGVVVDDTIHLVHHFGRDRASSGCSLRAIREAIEKTGRALVITSLVLAIGFFSFLGASLSNVADFGLYCGVGVLLALVADLLVLPALIAIAAPCPPDCACGGELNTDLAR